MSKQLIDAARALIEAEYQRASDDERGPSASAKTLEALINEMETPAADLQARLERDRGICTCIVESEAENARRIRFILSAYESLLSLQKASRTQDDWEPVHDLPCDFSTYRYRLSR